VPDRHPDQNLLRELEPAAERLLHRHLSTAMHHREQFAEAPRAVQPAALGGTLRLPPPNADLAVGQKPMLGTCVMRESVEARTRESAT
jgi:hypothetical protein